ncbi:hypothetical protein SAMN05421837_103868 [Amycolatopsis pretoriensis]|uniref:Uncharacterized protein n=1 Tax=Amycolatopsis pretoriensis TaxID=218821 RepID=A0A1H5QMV8_9PSEU|nr:hypothetical protein [Amycolatopsis pretoriensis]SEF27460.1 hypothetical protein SAMN05421837_103868 [Amycolatopsis pretoriensis]
MDQWLTIEVFDGESTATLWRLAHGDALTEAALTNGAEQWVWHEHRWGVVLEIEFASEERRDAFRGLPVVTAALDAVPDPARGLLVYPGRGGGAGSRMPRRPRPLPMAGAGAVPVPVESVRMGLAESMPPMFSEVG